VRMLRSSTRRRPVDAVEVEDASRAGQPADTGGDQAPAALWIGRVPGGVGSPGSGGCRPVRSGRTGLCEWSWSEARRRLVGGVAGLEFVLEQHECADQTEGTVNGGSWSGCVSGPPEHTFVS
jgi:hypothetical protein